MIRRVASVLILGLGLTVGLVSFMDGKGDVALADPGIHYVAPDGTCGGATPCYTTIQAAVDAAGDGDTIKVAAGTYGDVQNRPTPEGYIGPATIRQVVLITETVTLRGGYTAGNWMTSDPASNPTILDAQGQGRVLLVSGAISPTIEGLRMTGGDATGLGGVSWGDVGGGGYIAAVALALNESRIDGNHAHVAGGLFLDRGNVVLSNNTVVSNTASVDAGGLYLNSSYGVLHHNMISGNVGRGWGGGVVLSASGALLSGNTITANRAVHGGGICVVWSGATLDGNRISGNEATSSGGGVLLYFSDALVEGNLISGNTAGHGGGLDVDGRSPTLINNVVADNQASGGAGIQVVRASPRLLHTTIARNAVTGGAVGSGDGVYVANYSSAYSTVIMTNTIITDHDAGIRVLEGNTATLNATLWYGNIRDWTGAGVIHHANDHYGDPAFAPDGYHLLTIHSAAIDRGVATGVAMDIDNEERPRGMGFDMGADEFRGWSIYVPATFKRQ